MRFCLDLILKTAVLANVAVTFLPAAGLPGSDGLPNSVAAVHGTRSVWVVKVDTRTGKLVRTLVAAAPEELAQNGVRRGPVPGSFGGACRTLCAPKDNVAIPDVRGLVDEAAKNFDVN